MTELVNAALAYAHRGWHVFPLQGIKDGSCTCGREECSSPGKHPLVSHGLYEGTNETHNTLTARTGGGGLHFYFIHPERTLPNTTGRLPGLDETLEGIDVRARGGYVVAPPSLHISGGKYLWIDANQPIVELPDWIEEPERPATTLAAAGKAEYEGNGSAYGLAVLTGELDQLRTATPGTRNHALNRAAFAVGQVVAGGELEESHARTELLATALAIGLPEPEARQTLDSGLTAGAREPRSAPHRLK